MTSLVPEPASCNSYTYYITTSVSKNVEFNQMCGCVAFLPAYFFSHVLLFVARNIYSVVVGFDHM